MSFESFALSASNSGTGHLPYFRSPDSIISSGVKPADAVTSRADGAPLAYNQEDVLLPDLLVCRPELAEQIAGFVRRYWAENPPA